MLDNFKSWLNSPFNSSMSAQRWLAFVGLILLALIFWRIVLAHLEAV